jgi:hypothetical protein
MKESFKHPDLLWNAFKEKKRFATEIVASEVPQPSKKAESIQPFKSEQFRQTIRIPQKSGMKLTNDETFL